MYHRAVQLLAVCATAAAFLAPWATYGAYDVTVTDLPGWPWYPAAATVMHVLVHRRTTPWRIASLVACAATLAAALLVLSGYTDAAAIFGPGPIPMVWPRPSYGVLLAGTGALLCAVTRRCPPSGGRTTPPPPAT
ncbi:hypothetical protein [Actinosynnema sp. NPDC020468]|uniref:hypothetical protein n=1 Tax=Actinosynnema sp. NPDC020468 TaxID=3154488 RepID=UPI0033F61F21